MRTHKEIKQAYKISAPFLKNKTDDVDELLKEIKLKVYERYMGILDNINKTYSEIIKESASIVTKIDYYYCIAKIARLHNYVRPIITFEDIEQKQLEQKQNKKKENKRK